MNPYIEKLKQQIGEHPPDFNALYQAVNGMELREMDKIIYPVAVTMRKQVLWQVSRPAFCYNPSYRRNRIAAPSWVEPRWCCSYF